MKKYEMLHPIRSHVDTIEVRSSDLHRWSGITGESFIRQRIRNSTGAWANSRNRWEGHG